jgi:glycosyltransferase involved in cell wall biosynthesis
MKILLGCLNVNGLGGSELYHYELARELHQAGIDITLFTLREIDPSDQVRIKLTELGVKQVDRFTFNPLESYDLIVASQPQVNQTLLKHTNNTPIISIIHSEIRSEDPILDPRIVHYIGIRQSIVDMLINDYKIDKEKVSLIYNPIDTSRFKPATKKQTNKTKGIFVGEVLDPIRFKAVEHLVQSCIENDWELSIMSDSKYDFNHPNIKYIDKRWDTEEVVRDMDFTGGILLGRTTLEGLCCGVPGYVYLIDVNGNINSIELVNPEGLEKVCDSKYVAQQHINLYNTHVK